MRPAAPLPSDLVPGRAEYETRGSTGLEGSGAYATGRRRARARPNWPCCGAPENASPQSHAERKPARTIRTIPDARSHGIFLPRLQLQPEPECNPEPESEADTEDEFFSCSDGEDGSKEPTTDTTSCCPPEHNDRLAQMVARFGTDTPSPTRHTLWRFLCARKYNLEKASESYRQHLDWRRSGSIPTEPTDQQIAALQASLLPGDDPGAAGRRFYRLDTRDGDGCVMICCVLSAWVGLAPTELDKWLGAYILFIEETARLADEHPDPMQK